MNAILELVHLHDLRLVAVAVVICTLSAFAALTLLQHARNAKAKIRLVWLGIAAMSVGFGIWATHFIAMLSFSVGFGTGYSFVQTAVSLGAAIVLAGTGFWWALTKGRRVDAAIGGAVLGLGITAMHYLGMAALEMGGSIVWNFQIVALSAISGICFGALALFIGMSAKPYSRVSGSALLVLAICSMHFTGMAAAGMQNCFSIVQLSDTTPLMLSLALAIISAIILFASLIGVYLDLRDQQRSALEQARMLDFADAAVEGLVVCKGNEIVSVNKSFSLLVGRNQGDIAGLTLAAFLNCAVVETLLEKPDFAIEAELSTSHDQSIPTELILRQIDYFGVPHVVIAVRDLRARRQAEQEIQFLAHHDFLTQLPNRGNFNRRLAEDLTVAKRKGHGLAVLCLDLNKFKHVNDRFGHAAGDDLLKRVAECVRQSLSQTSSAARLGGDEFAIILPHITSRDEAGRYAELLLSSFKTSNLESSTPYEIVASIGIAVFPDDGDDPLEIASNADTALYAAKHESQGAYRFFDPAMGAEVRNRRQIETDLREALELNQLRLVYQPQLNIETGLVGGFEVLIRWQHPVHGNVSPALFIPIAEESGQVSQIDAWVLRNACAEAARWLNPLAIAVNISAVQLQSGNLAALILNTLEETGLSPSRLEIEITETAMVHDLDQALVTLRQIKALGVKITMDDFGTGYSSLANLRAFPFDKIKIDHSFVKDVDTNDHSAAIVRAVLGLGTALALPVVAEGVERVEELDFLKNENCAAAQGYLLGKPLEISHFSSLTNASARPAPAVKPVPALRLVG